MLVAKGRGAVQYDERPIDADNGRQPRLPAAGNAGI